MTSTKVKLSKNTLTILKNFSSINSNLLIKPGSTIKTIAPSKSVFAEAIVEEEFPSEVAIWDLGQFLGVVSLFNEPEFEFDDNFVRIHSNQSSVKYFYSAPSLLTVPSKDINMPKVTHQFVVTQQTFAELMKASSVLQVSDLELTGEDGIIALSVSKKNDPSSNSYRVEVGKTSKEFSYTLQMDDLKLLPGDYTVSLTDTVVSKFSHNNMSLNYYIAVTKG